MLNSGSLVVVRTRYKLLLDYIKFAEDSTKDRRIGVKSKTDIYWTMV